MLRPRIIPCLTISQGKLVKTVRFKNPKYIGDPINAIKIFNDKEVDELVVLDIHASKNGTPPNFELIEEFCSECFMPLAYGGGITEMSQIEKLIRMGVEKVILQSAAHRNPQLVRDAVKKFGSQSISCVVDYQKKWYKKGSEAVVLSGSVNVGRSPLDQALMLESLGVGELILQDIDREGTFTGYDLDQIELISGKLSIPLIALGGASSMNDMGNALRSGASAASAASFFIMHPVHRAVLITYPEDDEIRSLL
jgi:cyclase